MTAKINSLEELQIRKAELALKCKAKEAEITLQTDYIIEHLGVIAIKNIVGSSLKKASETKTEILKLLVIEGIDTAVNIQKDPHDIKDKLLNAFKKSASAVLNLLFK